MKANELRLGNWAYVVDEESTQKKTPVQVNLTWLQIPEALEQIPLTPEILERCRFDCSGDGKAENKYSIQVGNYLYLECLDDRFNDWSVDPPNGSGWIWGKIKYIHQLQNLYYSLTGEELNIEL